METYVNRWLQTVDGVNKLINNFSKMVLFTDMAASLQGSPAGQNLVQRMQAVVLCGNNQGMFAVNKDTEDLKNVAVPLAGLDKLQAQAQEHMCAPSQMPLVKLTGITPSGLNNSSEGEIQVWYDHIVSLQVKEYSPRLNTVLQLSQLDLFGEVDDSITYEYVPLMEPDGEALARQRKTDGEAGVGYINSGVISPEEERERLAGDPLSGYSNLDGPPPEAPPMMQAIEPGAGESDGDSEA
jgi:hypothetical protein